MNIEEFRTLNIRRNKYRNIKTVIDGIEFDSRAEAQRYCELKMLLMAKKIKKLVLQPKYELQKGFTYNGRKIKAINYIADFAYYEMSSGKNVVEDVKGVRTKEFNLKYKMFLKKYPDKELRIIK